MFDDRAFIQQVEAAGTAEFARKLARPDPDEERALRDYFGDEHYDRLRRRALPVAGSAARRPGVRRGNVVVIHGIAGGELISVDEHGDRDQVWINLPRIVLLGALARLRLEPDGVTDAFRKYRVVSGGMLKRWYGEILLSLASGWNVSAFAYDWRKSVDLAADRLHFHLNARFRAGRPVHLVAHSMGGLVARSFIRRHPDHWRSLWDRSGRGALGGRLVMLGTPNHGSFAIPQLIAGIEVAVEMLALADILHSKRQLMEILNTFPGSLEMLPSHLEMPEVEPLYAASTYGEAGPLQAGLDAARQHHNRLAGVVDPKRMIYLAGYKRPTLCAIRDMGKVADPDAYVCTWDGDGRVPHRLGFLRTAAGEQVPAYFADADHGSLQSDPAVLEALDDLLRSGATGLLAATLPARGGAESAADAESAQGRRRAVREASELEWRRILAVLREEGARRRGRGRITEAERRAHEVLGGAFIGAGAQAGTAQRVVLVPGRRN